LLVLVLVALLLTVLVLVAVLVLVLVFVVFTVLVDVDVLFVSTSVFESYVVWATALDKVIIKSTARGSFLIILFLPFCCTVTTLLFIC
jgi:hypothetical protein